MSRKSLTQTGLWLKVFSGNGKNRVGDKVRKVQRLLVFYLLGEITRLECIFYCPWWTHGGLPFTKL